MSQINVDNLIKQSNFKSNIYLPVIEAIVNSIDAIDDENRNNIDKGEIVVQFERDYTLLEKESKTLPNIVNVKIYDNGIGFNKENTEAFDTLFTENKINRGGKGFGRIMYKKHFHKIRIDSVFFDQVENTYKKREFNFGNKNIVENDKISDITENQTWTELTLEGVKEGHFDKKMETISKKILENLLSYFITDDFEPPSIILRDTDSTDIHLKTLYESNEYIKRIESGTFTLKDTENNDYNFTYYLFKIYSPQNQKSTINLVADRREVTSVNTHEYLSDFYEEFYDNETGRNFIVKAYVLGDYLNENVDLERLSFRFGKDNTELLFPLSQSDIENDVAKIIENIFQEQLTPRKEKKKVKINEYVKENPWFSEYSSQIDLNKLPMHPSEEEIETHLHKIKYNSEKQAKNEISNILKNVDEDFEEKISDVFKSLDKAKQSELAHYVSLRKVVLDIFQKVLERNNNQTYSREQLIHNIIFPVKKDSTETKYNDHNLWVLDERLSYTEYLSSDKPVFDDSADRPDIFCFDKKVAFRGENDLSNPITIFEFKRPGRDDFTNQSSKEDPYEQITRYIEEIKEGKLTSMKGRPIAIGDTTPFYGYIVADLTGKVKDWLIRKDFDPAPDGEGYFKYHKAYNLYTEFLSWDKLLKDAHMRNKVFFNKLGI